MDLTDLTEVVVIRRALYAEFLTLAAAAGILAADPTNSAARQMVGASLSVLAEPHLHTPHDSEPI